MLVANNFASTSPVPGVCLRDRVWHPFTYLTFEVLIRLVRMYVENDTSEVPVQ